MADSGPDRPSSPEPSSPPHPASGSQHARRRLAAILLLLAVSTSAVVLRNARVPSSVAPLQEPGCPGSLEAEAASCEFDANVTTTEEPFPAGAEAQVNWVLRHHHPALVLFYSQICRPCMMMDALVQMVRRDYEPHVVFIEVAADEPENAALVRRMSIGAVPTSLFILPSGDMKRVSGVMKQQELRAVLAELAAAVQPVLPAATAPGSP